MISLLKTIVKLLRDILEILRQYQEIINHYEQKKVAKFQKRLSRQDVMEMLNITKSTYTRWVEAGILKPENPTGIHSYTEADLEKAMQESKRKGNV